MLIMKILLGGRMTDKYFLDEKNDIRYATGMPMVRYEHNRVDMERLCNELNQLYNEKERLSKELWHLRRVKSAFNNIKEAIDWGYIEEELERKENYNIK